MVGNGVSERDRGDPQLPVEQGVRVLVVDDQQSFRSVLGDLVRATRGFVLAGEAASGEDALGAMDELSPDFVVMDVRMPGMGGIQATRALLERYPDRVVLLVSARELDGPRPTALSGRTIPFVYKADLRRAVLRDVWDEAHGGA